MNAIGVDGEIGRQSSPINSAFALFRQITRVTPDMPPSAMAIVTNGDFDHKTPEKFSSLLATCRMPQVYVYDQNDEERGGNVYNKLEREVIKKVCDYIDTYFDSSQYFKTGNGIEMSERKQHGVDVVAESVNKIPKEGFMLYFDRDRLNLGVDRIWFNNFCSELQYKMQNVLDVWRINPRLKSIGYGLFSRQSVGKARWKLERRPNSYIKVSPRMVVKVQPTTIDIAPIEGRYQACYAYVAAYMLKEFMERSGNLIAGYTIHDWVAIVNLILAGINGFGDTPTIKHYSSTDNQTTIDHSIGFAFTMANRYMWGIDEKGLDIEDWKRYFKFCIALGLASTRIRVPTQDFEVVKAANADHTVWDRFKRVTSATIPKFGSFGNLTLLMARNTFRHGANSDQPFPCLLDYELEESGNLTERKILDKANEYSELPKYKPVTFEQVTIEQGRYPMNFIDYTSMVQRYITLKPMNDAQVIETDYSERQVLRWMFNLSEVVSNGVDNERRKLFWLVGLLSNGESVLTQGYVQDVSFGIFNPVRIRYYSTTFGETSIFKEGSATKGEQIPKPSATGFPSEQSDKKEGEPPRHDVQEPPVIKPIETTETVETADGEKKEQLKS